MRLGDGFRAYLSSFLMRVFVKVITDFSGCLHFRHPFELGGLSFSLTMVWAQLFPFLALIFYTEEDNNTVSKNNISLFLVCSFGLWVVTNCIFFCYIDISYASTFFGLKTGTDYVSELFECADSDFQRWDAVFTNRIQYSKPVHEKVKVWVKENIQKWRDRKEKWFNIELIPDEFLPVDVFNEEGGDSRRRSVRERGFVGIGRLGSGLGGEMMVE